jgi:hypothetical protein
MLFKSYFGCHLENGFGSGVEVEREVKTGSREIS